MHSFEKNFASYLIRFRALLYLLEVHLNTYLALLLFILPQPFLLPLTSEPRKRGQPRRELGFVH